MIISFCCTFIYYFWLHGLFSSGSEWRLLSSYGVQASHRGGCSHCGARAPGVGYGRINEESRKSMQDGAALQRGRMNYCLLMYIHTYWLHHVHPPTQACTHTQHEHAHTTCSHYTRTHAHGSAHTLCTPHTHTVYCVLHTHTLCTVYSTHRYTAHTHMYTRTPHSSCTSPGLSPGYMDSGIYRWVRSCYTCVPLNTQERWPLP